MNEHIQIHFENKWHNKKCPDCGKSLLRVLPVTDSFMNINPRQNIKNAFSLSSIDYIGTIKCQHCGFEFDTLDCIDVKTVIDNASS